MERVDNESHDFMSVDSFSQLPFIRPAPVREKGIRLFGIEFGHRGGGGGHDLVQEEEASSESGNANMREEAKENSSSNEESSGRRFECHYCCRNFPTSQALGGHQNAHKRERQHAKRAHLMAAHNNIAGHLFDYGISNFRPTVGYGLSSTHSAPPTPSYLHHPWHERLYGGHVAIDQHPIEGSPLPGLWRLPPSVQNRGYPRSNLDHSSSLPTTQLFPSGEEPRPDSARGPSQNRHVYDASGGSVCDHVSLDLRL